MIFICCVCGNFKFVIEWIKDGILLVFIYYYKVLLFGDLYILEVCVVDYGMYRCCVFNRVGVVVVMIRLIVMGNKRYFRKKNFFFIGFVI